MAEEILLVISTFPDAETARRIAQQLVTEKLAACANITAPGLRKSASACRMVGCVPSGGKAKDVLA